MYVKGLRFADVFVCVDGLGFAGIWYVERVRGSGMFCVYEGCFVYMKGLGFTDLLYI